MPKTSPGAQSGMRSHWLMETVRECQGLLSSSPFLGPNHLPKTASAFLARLEAPQTPVEKLLQRGLLLEVALQFGHAAHTAFHREHRGRGGLSDACGFVPAAAMEGWPHDLARSPAEAFRQWARRYAEAFRAAHPLSCALEAEDHLRKDFREPVSADALARRVACTTAFLRRTFKQLTSKSLLEYQSGMRLREAMRLLRATDLKMEAVAYEVGYRSKKDLYRVIQASLGCTPLEYRRGHTS